MVDCDRKVSSCCYGMIMLAIIPFSTIIAIAPSSVIAQETRIETVTIYVDSQIGRDSNQGTKETPLKTITQALKIALPNQIISLAPGTYSEATGEVFPLIIREPIILKGLTHGQGQSVLIEGGGSFISPTAAEQNVTIAAIKNAGTIKGITVTNPNSRGHGLWIESADPQVTDNTFTRNGNTGLSVNGNSKPLIQNNYFHNNNGNGLLVYGTSAPQVEDNLFDNTGFGVSLVQNANPILQNNNFQGNRIGIILEGQSQAKLRGNEIINSLEYGLVAIANSQVDLGTASESGNNIFRNNKKLDIQNLTTNLISATGTQINGVTAGQIDFSDRAIANLSDRETIISNSVRNAGFSRLRNNPLPDISNNNSLQTNVIEQEPDIVTPDPQTNPPLNRAETLPPPPPINNVPGSDNSPKELVFSAPESNGSPNSLPPNSAPNSNYFVRPKTTNPSSLNNNINSNNVSSLSDLLSTTTSTIKYRVLVEFENNQQQEEIQSFYPEAFNTVYQSQTMLQVGAFSDRKKAETTSRSLADLGFQVHILE